MSYPNVENTIIYDEDALAFSLILCINNSKLRFFSISDYEFSPSTHKNKNLKQRNRVGVACGSF